MVFQLEVILIGFFLNQNPFLSLIYPQFYPKLRGGNILILLKKLDYPQKSSYPQCYIQINSIEFRSYFDQPARQLRQASPPQDAKNVLPRSSFSQRIFVLRRQSWQHDPDQRIVQEFLSP